MRNHSKGVGELVGAIMFITLMLLTFGLIAWNGQIYNAFLNSVNTKENNSSSQASELLSITGFKFNQDKLNLTVLNGGPNYVRIVRIWLLNLTSSPAWHTNFAVSIYLNPGNTVTNVGQTFGTIHSSMLYTVKLITQRGNIFSETNYVATSVLGLAQGVGWVTIDWYSYKFTSSNYLTPQPAWNFSKSQVGIIQFQLGVSNHWVKDLTLTQYTYLKLDKSATSGSALVFYLMDPNSKPYPTNQIQCYNQATKPYVLHPNTNGDTATGGLEVTLVFLGKGTGSQCASQSALQADQFSVYLVLYYQYTVGTTTYTLAQTIPFEATNISA